MVEAMEEDSLVVENDKNYGYPPNANYGDGNSSKDTDFPRNNMGQRYLEQYLSQAGPIKWGRVIEVFVGSKVCLVSHTDGTTPCAWLGNISQYTGAMDLSVPVNGSHVLVWIPVSGFGLILGGYGEGHDDHGVSMDVATVNQNAIASPFDALTEKRHSFHLEKSSPTTGYANSGRPMDVLPGDQGWMDGLGGVIALLQGLSMFKASELAQIQAFHIDDLLRVIGRNLEVWTGGSQSHLVQSGNNVNYELIFADTVAGALGEKEPGAQISEEGGENDLFERLKNRDENPTLRKRLLIQAGTQGNLATIYVCKDKDGEAHLTDSGLYPGVTKIHVGRDGEVSLLSTRSITLRKVKRIRVPERAKEPFEVEPPSPASDQQFQWVGDGQDGDDARALQQNDRDRYKENIYDDKNLKDDEEFHPFEGLVEDTVPPAPEEGELEYREEEVSLHIGDDGSCSITNSAGSSIELTSDGDIKIHAARDLFIESGRSTHVFSAKDLTTRSRENTDITSSEQSLRLYAKKMGLLYTEEGAILLETNSKAGEPTGGVPEERVNSGIMLRTLNEESPIVLESQQDKIVASSQLNTSFQVLDPDSKFYFEGPLWYLNLTSGPQQMKVKGSLVDYDIDNSIRVNVQNSFLINIASGALAAEAPFISFSAGVYAKFHAPTPGVDVAHTHFGNEFVYAADAHGIFTTAIIKTNAFQAVPVTNLVSETFLDNTTPHAPELMAELLFDWREEYDIQKWYETTWQNKLRNPPPAGLSSSGDENWDLLADEVRGTNPFPGKDLPAKRFQYNRANPEGSQPVAQAGQFSATSEYKVPSSE